MIPDLVAVALICGALGYVIGSALYVWWRLRTIGRGLHQVGWDLDALAGALRKREENETPERTYH